MRVVKSWETCLVKELTLCMCTWEGERLSNLTSRYWSDLREIDTKTFWLKFEGESAKFKDNQQSALCYTMTKSCKTGFGKTTVSGDGSTVKSLDVLTFSFIRNIEKTHRIGHFLKAFIIWNSNVIEDFYMAVCICTLVPEKWLKLVLKNFIKFLFYILLEILL